MEKFNINKREKIVGASIPDSDMAGWMEVMRDSNLTTEEIDRFFSRLNKTYKDVVYPVEKEIDEKLEETIKYIKETHNKSLTNEEIEYLRRGIEQSIKDSREK